MIQVRRLVLVPAVLVLASCAHRGTDGSAARADDVADAATPQAAFWRHLQALCPAAAEGRLLRAPEGDTQIDPGARLVVHFWECGDQELRFPLHVGENHSRTWVFIRHADALELRHDHRHEDGLEESNTWYGASTADQGTATRQEFVFERDGMMVGWQVEIEPGRRFTYGTTRAGEWRHHLEFDLTRDVETPPLPWGHDTRPSQRPDPTG
ncbi:MAG TPA: hypothetical protein VM778_02045 [Gemmatimonadota bacterium]|nr:hypothetical protein [Gemmatimonadota bacterium]